MPSAVQNSSQYDKLTTSNDGRNVRASLQALSHFFLEDGIFTQTETNCFGAKSATEFATTSGLTFSGSKKVYAICQGQVFVQPQENNTDKVNVILKPYRQPINSIPLKYFIYRGLNKDDFFSSIEIENVNRLKIAGSESTGTALVQYLWKEFNNFYKNDTANKPEFLEQFIGYPVNSGQQDAQDQIDKYFFRVAEYNSENEELPATAFELPVIPRGIHLGNATEMIGIDVVLNNGDYYIENDPFQLNLAFARSAHYTLETPGANTAYQNKLIKEASTGFVDIAAFYGLHASGNGKIYTGTNNTPVESDEAVYTLLENYHTKNAVYLYIQSNRQRTYNFYGNYIKPENGTYNLKIGNTVETLTEALFGEYGWPVHKVNNPGNRLAFTLLTDKSEDASAYIQSGFLVSEHEDNFIRKANLLESNTESEEIVEFVVDTKPIILSFPLATGNKTIPSFIQCLYEGMVLYAEDPSDNSQYALKDIDDTFGLLDAKSSIIPRSSSELPSVIDNRMQLVYFNNTDIAVIKTKRTEDIVRSEENVTTQRVTYETILTNIRQNNTAFSGWTVSQDSTTAKNIHFDDDNNNYYHLEEPYYWELLIFTHALKKITGLNLKTGNETTPSKKILGVTEAEKKQLTDLIIDNGLLNAKIFLSNLIDNKDAIYISEEGISYQMFKIGIIAESAIAGLKIHRPQTDIIVYCIDNYTFFTRDYSINITSDFFVYSNLIM